MPAQVSQSKLLAGLGGQLVKSHNAHRAEDAPTPNMDLPGGIKGGVAQVRRVWIGEFKEGKHKGRPFFMAQASVVSPLVHEGVRVAGLFTRIGTEPLCDTPEKTGERSRKTFDDHYQWMLGQLKLIAGKGVIEKIGGTPEQIAAGIEGVMAALTKQKPYIAFETREGQKQTTGPYANRPPMIFHEWGGLVSFTPQVPQNGVHDETPAAEEPAAEEFNEFAGGEAGAEGIPDAETLDDLAARAESSDETAVTEMWRLWEGPFGKTEADAAELSFADMAEAMKGGAEATEEAAEEEAVEEPEEAPEPEPWKPKKGETCRYKFVDPKTKKKGKAVDCKIEALDIKGGGATIKNLATKKSFKVKVADLLPPE